MNKTLSLLAMGAALVALPALAHAQTKHPDFTGAWIVSPYKAALKPADGSAIPFKPEARKVYDEHLAAAKKGDRSWDDTTTCLPEGLPRLELINEPFEIMQRDKAMYFVAQNRLPWRAYFNEKLPDLTQVDTMYLGYHVAHWDGPKLVVDSDGFRDVSVLDDSGIPHSEKLHLTATYQMGADGKTMTVTWRIEDPDTFTRPWTAKATFKRMPASFQMPEEVCAAKLATTRPQHAE